MRLLRRSVTASASSVAGDERSVRLGRQRDHYQAKFFAMGSPCEVLVECADQSAARQLADIAAAEAWRIEDKFSRYLPGNIVDQINRSDGKTIRVDEETASLLDFAASLYELSERRFDITSGVLRKAWTFDGSDRVPTKSAVRKILDGVGWQKLVWVSPHLTLQPGMQIDFGGIGKEYAVDKAARLLADNSDVACLVNFGGDLFATRPPSGSRGWQVGIEAPDASDKPAQKQIRLKNGGLATSGDARRFILKNGVRYSHILDPTTGWPITSAPRSITVAADTCTQAGMLATLAMLKGADAEYFLRQQDVQHWCFR